MRIIFLGDVFGKPGRQLVINHLQRLKLAYQADICILNGENLADGKGLTEKTTKPLFNTGIDAITSGNHLWDRTESLEYIKNEPRIVKPLNYPEQAIGNPYYLYDENDIKLIVLTLTGQLFMPVCDSPVKALDNYLSLCLEQGFPVLIDFHAESTAEKRAFALMFDGKVSAILGTHTHIQTADEEILPQGTGYITDAGMTGPHDSVIGIKKNIIIEKIKTGMPKRYEVSNSGLQINGVILEIDSQSGKTTFIHRIKEHLEE